MEEVSVADRATVLEHEQEWTNYFYGIKETIKDGEIVSFEQNLTLQTLPKPK